MKKTAKRLLALLLTFAMSLSMLSSTAWAVSVEEEEESVPLGTDYHLTLPEDPDVIGVPNADEIDALDVESDPTLSAVQEEIEAMTAETGITDEQMQQILYMYQQYDELLTDNPEYFGVQTPFFANKTTETSPLGSLLSIAGMSQDAIDNGQVDYDTLMGTVQLFYLGNLYAKELWGDTLLEIKDEALKAVKDSGAKSTEQKLLVLNDWLAHHCNFDMPYIMSLEAPEPAKREKEDELTAAVESMLTDTIKQQIIQQLMDEQGMDEETATQYVENDPDMQNTIQQQVKANAPALVDGILGLWEGNHIGALCEGTAVCLGYSNAYAYLVQWLFEDVYHPNGTWKTKEELNNKNGEWDSDAGYMVDYVKIHFDASVTMYGQTNDHFGSDHYWNAVKVDGKWYYIDPCYTDIFIECMSRDRVETDGNMNHLYFMLSDTSARELYDGNYSSIDTLYQNLATDESYEDSWFSRAKSNVYTKDGNWYYFYDSTDVLDLMGQYGGMMGNRSASNGRSSVSEMADYGDFMGDTEYKLVAHDGSKDDTDASFTTLVDFVEGQIYDPTNKVMVDSPLIKKLYAEHEDYQDKYPSIAISSALNGNNLYFNISNCILSYNLSTGVLTQVTEYNEVSANRDMSVALGGMGFTVADNGDYSVTNSPIASMTIKDDGKMYVSVATNYAFVSGKAGNTVNQKGVTSTKNGAKTPFDDITSNGYEFEETNYNPDYNSYMKDQASQWGQEEEINDNDEFMWTANFVDTISLSHLEGSSHSYQTVNVEESCEEDAYSESRCSTCGRIENGATEDPSGASTASVEELDGEEIPSDKAVLTVKVVDSENDDNVLGTDSIGHLREESEETSYKFGNEEILRIAANIMPDDYKLEEDKTYEKEVPYGQRDEVTVTATKESPTPDPDPDPDPTLDPVDVTLTINIEGAEEVGITSTTMTRTIPSDEEEYTFEGAKIKGAVEAKVGSDYTVGGCEDVKATRSETEVNTKVTVTKKEEPDDPDPTPEPVKVTLTINIKGAEEGATAELTGEIASDAEEYTFTAKEIQGAVEAVVGTDDYTVDECKDVKATREDTNPTTEVTVTKKVNNVTSTLEITIVNGDAAEDAENRTVATTSISATGPEGDPCEFTVDKIKEAVDAALDGKDYAVADDQYQAVSTTYGANVERTYTATSTQAAATLNVTIIDGNAEEDAENTTLTTATVTKTGTKGENANFTADEIKTQVEAALTTGNYDYEVATTEYDNAVTAAANATYGGTAVDVSVTATKKAHGHGHEYVKFNETYYTHVDDDSAWNTGTVYVCIHCKDVKDSLEEGDKEYSVSHGSSSTKWRWSDDKSCATVIVSSVNDNTPLDCIQEGDYVSRVQADIEKQKDGNWSCEEGGTMKHVATATVNGSQVSDTQSVTVDPSSCSYKTPADEDFAWSNDLKSCTLTVTCTVCGTAKTIDCTVTEETTDPTCTTGGFTAHTATATLGVNSTATSTRKTDEVAALGHDYDENGLCKRCQQVETLETPTIKSVANSTSGVTIKWEKVDKATGYLIYRKDDNGKWKALKWIEDGSTLAYTDSKAGSGKVVTYTIRAYRGSKSVVNEHRYDAPYWSGYDKTGMSVVRLKTPSLSTPANSSTGITVKWGKVTGAKGYRIYRKVNGKGSWQKIKTVTSGSTTSYTDKDVKNGTKYVYTVRAYSKASGKTDWSSYVSAGKTMYRLESSSISSLSNGSSKKMTVKWKKNSKASGYEIQYATKSDFSNKKSSKVTKNSTTSKTISKLTKKKKYYVRVRNYKTVSGKTYYSGWSKTKNVTIKK